MKNPQRRTAAVSGMLLFFALAPAFAEPDALQILRRASFDNPSAAYEGRIVSFVRHGKESRVSDVKVRFQPPNLYRREFFSIQDELEEVMTTDGTAELIYFPKTKTAWKGEAAKSREKSIKPEEEWKLLTANYEVKLSGSERVAGKDAWVVRVLPKDKGKPTSALWIDKSQPIVLQSKQFNPDGSLAVRSHFTDIDFPKDMDPGLFRFEPPAGAKVREHGLEPEFMSVEEMRGTGSNKFKVPDHLPAGFAFAGGTVFEINDKEVSHLRFTDGAVVLSLFESAHPIVSKDASMNWEPMNLNLGALGFSGAGKVVRWESKGHHFVLVGNLSTPSLKQIADSLK